MLDFQDEHPSRFDSHIYLTNPDPLLNILKGICWNFLCVTIWIKERTVGIVAFKCRAKVQVCSCKQEHLSVVLGPRESVGLDGVLIDEDMRPHEIEPNSVCRYPRFLTVRSEPWCGRHRRHHLAVTIVAVHWSPSCLRDRHLPPSWLPHRSRSSPPATARDPHRSLVRSPYTKAPIYRVVVAISCLVLWYQQWLAIEQQTRVPRRLSPTTGHRWTQSRPEKTMEEEGGFLSFAFSFFFPLLFAGKNYGRRRNNPICKQILKEFQSWSWLLIRLTIVD